MEVWLMQMIEALVLRASSAYPLDTDFLQQKML